MDAHRFGSAGLVVAACLGGCAPSVQVVHTLRPAVELPPGGPLRVGRFEAVGGDDWTAAALREAVVESFIDAAGSPPQPDGDAEAPGEPRPYGRPYGRVVSGSAEVAVREQRGTRQGRRRDAAIRPPVWADGELVGVELAYLLRRVDVRTVLTVAPADDETAAPARLEVRQSYDSSRDPRVRGADGLARADDPDRVPPTDRVVRELLARCAARARAMVEPVRMPVTLSFRPVGGTAAAEGLKAARRRDFATAVEHFRTALRQLDDGDAPIRAAVWPRRGDLLFNLAAAHEADSHFAQAERRYRAALRASDGRDEEARAAAERVAALGRRVATAEPVADVE
ncbi:MAG: tetratricopeptide repeat protein [Planctomycetota bacterium]